MNESMSPYEELTRAKRERDDGIGTVRWFGESWGAPINDPRAQISNPVDTKCIDCGRYIESDDQGVGILSVGIDHSLDGYVYYHLDCFMRMLGLTPTGELLDGC
jgi:hypothetical protein